MCVGDAALCQITVTTVIRPHRSMPTTYVGYMRPIVTDEVGWSACRLVGLSVTIVSPAKTAEPMQMPFGTWTQVEAGACTMF